MLVEGALLFLTSRFESWLWRRWMWWLGKWRVLAAEMKFGLGSLGEERVKAEEKGREKAGEKG